MSVLDKPLQNLVEGKTLQEVILVLFQHSTNAGTIMSLCHISEAELETFIPRSMWVGHINTPCRSCRGRGYHSKEVPWEQDQSYYKSSGLPPIDEGLHSPEMIAELQTTSLKITE